MNPPIPHRKRVRHYNQPGDIHELTFSCFHQKPLLAEDRWKVLLSQSIDAATQKQGFDLLAFVYMPEHVHLLVYPTVPEPRLDLLLKAIKRPFSFRVKEALATARSPLLELLRYQRVFNASHFHAHDLGWIPRDVEKETSSTPRRR